MSEARLQAAFLAAARREGLDPVVMAPAPVGWPDVDTALGLVEIKYVRRPSSRAAVLRCPTIRPQQRARWARRRAAGGACFVLIGVGPSAYLLDAAWASRRLGHVSLVAIARAARASWSEPHAFECLADSLRSA